MPAAPASVMLDGHSKWVLELSPIQTFMGTRAGLHGIRMVDGRAHELIREWRSILSLGRAMAGSGIGTLKKMTLLGAVRRDPPLHAEWKAEDRPGPR